MCLCGLNTKALESEHKRLIAARARATGAANGGGELFPQAFESKSLAVPSSFQSVAFPPEKHHLFLSSPPGIPHRGGGGAKQTLGACKRFVAPTILDSADKVVPNQLPGAPPPADRPTNGEARDGETGDRAAAAAQEAQEAEGDDAEGGGSRVRRHYAHASMLPLVLPVPR